MVDKDFLEWLKYITDKNEVDEPDDYEDFEYNPGDRTYFDLFGNKSSD